MELSIVSEEYITPSFPTPQHLRTHLLSFIDQSLPPIGVNILLFYSVGVDLSTYEINVDEVFAKRLRVLKQSLSKTLSSFYQLAGTVKNEISIDCNDEGVYFIEANVKASLCEVLQQVEFFHKLQPGGAEIATRNNAMVQVTRFACGGMAISALISHKIVDASSLHFFFRSWAATANVDNEPYYRIAIPDFDAVTRFPRNDAVIDTKAVLPPFFFKTGNSVTKRFRFDAEAIAALKAKSSSFRCKQKPSRVEVVSALLCKSIAAAMKARSDTVGPLYILHVVNLRRKATPPFSESCMGNYVMRTPRTLGIADQHIELSDLVIKMREAITTTYHSEFVKCLQSEPTKLYEILGENPEATAATVHGEYILITSWCNFGFYDVDFGWGKPIWITTTPYIPNIGNSYVSFLFLMDTPSKGGVEGWITFGEEDKAMLEQDKEFTAFAVWEPNTSSLCNNEPVQKTNT